MSEPLSTPQPMEATRPTRLGRVVLAVVGLGATGLAFGLISLTRDTTLSPTQQRARTEIRKLQSFFHDYQRIMGRYPTQEQGFAPLIEGKALESVPVDPWNRPYLYRREGKKGYLLSLGADGKPGGTGEDADIDGGGVVSEPRP